MNFSDAYCFMTNNSAAFSCYKTQLFIHSTFGQRFARV